MASCDARQLRYFWFDPACSGRGNALNSADDRIEVSGSEVLVYGKKDEIVIQEVCVGKDRGIDSGRTDATPVYGGNSLLLQTEMRARDVIQDYWEYPRADGSGKIGMKKSNARKAPQMIAQKLKILAASRGDRRDVGMRSQPARYARHFLVDE